MGIANDFPTMMKSKVILLLSAMALASSVRAADFYVAPDGKPTNTGSISSPWDLQTALNHPAAVKPGDTIWLRNGIHRSNNRITKFTSQLKGAPNNPITVRQYPGERATVDGNISQYTGGWVNYWGFEIYNSNTNRYSSQYGSWPTTWWVKYDGKDVDLCVVGFHLQAPNVKLINLVVHDSIAGGFNLYKGSDNSEIYGCITYYNGWQAPDRAHGHGLYGQNAAPSVVKVADNVFYGNLALGLQATGAGPEPVADNFQLDGNLLFQNGILAQQHQQNMLIGAYQGRAQNPRITANMVYDTKGSGSDSYIGYTGGSDNAVVQNNYFGTSAMFSPANYNMTVSGNVFAGGTVNLDKSKYPNNTYHSSKPTQNAIFVRPNKYEAGRGHIVIYNWQRLNTVSVDPSSVGLKPGDIYELRNTQNYYGDVITGTYNGGSISIPMTGRTVAKPQGSNFSTPASTFPEFGAFVIMKKSGGTPPVNTAPVVSSISNRTIQEDGSTGAISFTVSDKETSADKLTVTVSSSNQSLVPNSSIALGGSGSNRTINITPVKGQSGTATITIRVSDGMNTTETSFVVTVTAVNKPPTISSIPAQSTKQDNSVGPIGFTISDRETPAANLTLTGTSSNTALVPNGNIVFGGSGANRTVTVTPAKGQSGNVTITVRVSDGVNAATTSFALTVEAVNTPPTISSIPAQTVNEGASTAAIPFVIGDAETPAGSLTLAASSSDTSLVPVGNIVFGGSGANRTVRVTPVTGRSGSALITISVSDGKANASTSFNLTVNPADDDPNTDYVYLGVEAEDGDLVSPVRVMTDSKVPGRKYILTPTGYDGSATYRIEVPKAGTYYMWNKILGETFASDSFFVVVNGQEDVFDAAENKTSPNWQWSVLNGRGGTGVPLTLEPRKLSLVKGQNTIVIRGREPNTGLDRFIITDNPNYTPVELVATDDTVAAYTGVTTEIAHSDLLQNDYSLFEDKLTISSVGSAAKGKVVLNNSTISYTPNAGFSGEDTFTYTVRDETGATSTAKVTVEVKAADRIHLGIEAEAGTVVAPMTVITDSKTPSRKYIASSVAEKGTVTYTIDIPKTDTYVIWTRILAPTFASDSFYVSVDGKEDIFDAAENKQSPNWQWSVVNGRGPSGVLLALNPRTFQLTAGKHTIVVRGREPNAGLDRIIITNDRDYVPQEVAATGDKVSAPAGTTTKIAAADLLKNDVSLFSDTMTITAVRSGSNGTATLSGQTVNYTPKAGFTGTDSFTYTVADALGNTSTATVTVTVIK